jgi:hypothetical protein
MQSYAREAVSVKGFFHNILLQANGRPQQSVVAWNAVFIGFLRFAATGG